MANFATDFLKLRKTMELTQRQFGVALGITSNYTARLERGETDPSDTLVKLVNNYINNPTLRNKAAKKAIQEDANASS